MMDTEVMGAMKGKTMRPAGEGMGEGPTAPHPFAKAEYERRKKEDPASDDSRTEAQTMSTTARTHDSCPRRQR